MQSPDQLLKLLVVVGPTGVGKSAMAISIAQKFNGEIVSADSRLFYRGMDIGTAKPSIAERQGIQHHLIDVAEPDHTLSLAYFQQEARHIISEIHGREALPILVGGTGQYIRSVIEDWRIPSQPADPELRKAIERWGHDLGYQGLYDRLVKLDPIAAGKIDPRNMRRTIRALEVIFHSGYRFSLQKKKGVNLYNSLVIGLRLPRGDLFKRVDDRIDKMFESGFLDEVHNLLKRGYRQELPSMSAIGYREGVEILQGKISQEDAKVRMRQLTHQFVRRQANWFKEADPNINWIDADEQAIHRVEKLINLWLEDR